MLYYVTAVMHLFIDQNKNKSKIKKIDKRKKESK